MDQSVVALHTLQYLHIPGIACGIDCICTVLEDLQIQDFEYATGRFLRVYKSFGGNKTQDPIFLNLGFSDSR